MREVAILGSIIFVAVLLCLSCGCDRKTLIKSELDNPLVAEELRAVSGGGSSSRIAQVYKKFYVGMSVQDVAAMVAQGQENRKIRIP